MSDEHYYELNDGDDDVGASRLIRLCSNALLYVRQKHDMQQPLQYPSIYVMYAHTHYLPLSFFLFAIWAIKEIGYSKYCASSSREGYLHIASSASTAGIVAVALCALCVVYISKHVILSSNKSVCFCVVWCVMDKFL